MTFASKVPSWYKIRGIPLKFAAPQRRCSSCARLSGDHPTLRRYTTSPSSTFPPTMASSPQSPLFTQRVVKAMQTLYPLELADRAWDNVGLLQENIDHEVQGRDSPSTVLLTNDLTLRVAQEAILKKASVIVSYHPFIFRGLKSISLADPHQRILLQLAQHNIAVYSPHTALDGTPGGMNDWLADMVEGLAPGVATKRSVVKPIPGPIADAGYGRLVQFNKPMPLGRIIEAFARGMGGLPYIQIARPKIHSAEVIAKGQLQETPAPLVSSVAVCAGSGHDILKDTTADLIVTGEMSHHSALRLTMLGKTVITVFHSNCERKFLRDVLLGKLQAELRKEDYAAQVLISEEDEDPFETWDVRNLPSFVQGQN